MRFAGAIVSKFLLFLKIWIGFFLAHCTFVSFVEPKRIPLEQPPCSCSFRRRKQKTLQILAVGMSQDAAGVGLLYYWRPSEQPFRPWTARDSPGADSI